MVNRRVPELNKCNAEQNGSFGRLLERIVSPGSEVSFDNGLGNKPCAGIGAALNGCFHGRISSPDEGKLLGGAAGLRDIVPKTGQEMRFIPGQAAISRC